MRHDEWQTRKGSRVKIEQNRRGEFIVCEGCPRPIRITGAGAAWIAAEEHARTCGR